MGKEKTLADMVEELIPHFARENRTVSKKAVCVYVSDHFRELTNNYTTPISADGILKQLDRETDNLRRPTEAVTKAIGKLYSQLHGTDKIIELTPARPKSDYHITEAREMFGELVEIYGSERGVGKLVSDISRGRLKPETAPSLRKKTKKSCSKTLGDTLKRLLEMSRLHYGMTHPDVFTGIKVPDSRGNYHKIVQIHDFEAVLDNNETVPVRYSATRLTHLLNKTIGTNEHLTEMRVKGLLMAAIPFDNETWRAAFRNKDVYVPSSARQLLENMKCAEAYDPDRKYKELDAVILPRIGLVAVTQVTDNNITAVRPGKRYINIDRKKESIWSRKPTQQYLYGLEEEL
jgi:hypothetical protein